MRVPSFYSLLTHKEEMSPTISSSSEKAASLFRKRLLCAADKLHLGLLSIWTGRTLRKIISLREQCHGQFLCSIDWTWVYLI